jgi:hypothetical protein
LDFFLFVFVLVLPRQKNGAQAAASVFWTPAPGAAGGADRYRSPLVFLHRFISDFPFFGDYLLLWRLLCDEYRSVVFKFLKLAMSPENELSPSSRKKREKLWKQVLLRIELLL